MGLALRSGVIFIDCKGVGFPPEILGQSRTPVPTGLGKIFNIFIFGKKVLTKSNFGAILRESRDEIFEKGGKRK